MKLRYLLPLALLAIPACQPESAPSLTGPEPGRQTVVLQALPEQTAGKSTLDFPSVLWEDSDRIAVFDGYGKNVFTIPEGGNRGKSATFKGEVHEGAAELYAASPADAALECASGAITVQVPSVQRIGTGRCIAPEALVCVAKAEGGSLQFRNVISLVRVTVSRTDITAVILKGTNLSGSAVVAPDGTLSGVKSGAAEVQLLPEGETFAPGTYYAAVLPGATPAGGFSLSLVRSDALSGTRTASGQTVFQRGKGLDAGTPESAVSWEKLILTKQQLFAWNALRSDSDESDEVRLGADIDMQMDPWTPKGFAGSFDGQGHCLSGINVVSDTYAGFFRVLSGSAVVKNTVFGSADGSSYDGVSTIRHANPANNYTWYYAGVVGKVEGSASLSGIVNYATIEVAPGCNSKTRMGGIVGNWNSTSECKGLVNYGTVRNLASATGQAGSSDTTSNSSIMGGVVGFLDTRTIVSACINHGTVSNVNPGVSSVGGVVGYDGRGSTIKNCTNYGSVSHAATADVVAESAAAGIIAYAKGASSTFGSVSGCRNEGSVTASSGGQNFRLAGVSGLTQYYDVTDCTNAGEVRFSGTTTGGGYLAIGGVVAHTYNGCTIKGCRNEGPVSSNRLQVNRIGGVTGNLNSSIMRNCTNAGPVTLDISGTALGNWEGAGGIAGFAEGQASVIEISGCVNEAGGTVTAVVNTNGRSDYSRCAAGGILGMPYDTMSLTGNVNHAEVSLQNVHASAPYAYVGGIIGQDKGARGYCTVTDNINYGPVRSVSGRSGYSGAGGIFGNIASATSIIGNRNYGPVSGTVAGALAGINACSFSAVVCDAVTVNGTTYANASDKTAWACPSSTGTITVRVMPHSDPEAEPSSPGDAPAPLDPGNKVVAHRGGATECGYPDNSRAALRYAMSLGCYASECDIYWTKDNKVIVAHANSEDYINGMHPWEANAADIIAAKRLSNYERIPTLEEYIDIVMESGSKTKLLLDIKMIDTPSLDYDHPAKAALRAIEIVQEKNAQNFVEFICTGYTNVMSKIAAPMKAAGLNCGWMNGDISATTFKNKGYTNWANLNTRDHFKLGSGEDKGTGYRTITEFKNAGLQLSVFHIDKQSGNSSAVYTDATVQAYLDEYAYLRCITTNYPAWLIQKTKGL
ncbi:MAG: hypothetical protein J5640_00115 [Bacteroidales bacterium]|nr:hypothetical protein [Bacteroidales bacterium]